MKRETRAEIDRSAVGELNSMGLEIMDCLSATRNLLLMYELVTKPQDWARGKEIIHSSIDGCSSRINTFRVVQLKLMALSAWYRREIAQVASELNARLEHTESVLKALKIP